MRRWGLPVLAVLAAAVCVRLGFWQLDRLGQRRAMDADRAARMAQPPLRAARPGDLGGAEYRRVIATGAFDFAREVVVVSRSHLGTPGVHVVTPLRLAGGGAVLVVRGWVASPDARNVPLERLREPDSATVEGVALPPAEAGAPADSTFPLFVRDASPAALEARYPYPLAPLLLQRAEPSPGAPPALRAIVPPTLGNGPHLSYANQWFAFAVVAVVGGVAYARSAVRSKEVRSKE